MSVRITQKTVNQAKKKAKKQGIDFTSAYSAFIRAYARKIEKEASS